MQSYSFEKTDTGYQSYVGDMPVSDGYVENVRRAMRECTDKHIEVGAALIALYESRVYGVCLGGNFYQLHSSNFFSFCELRFGLDRSQVSRYIDVVYNFCRGDKLLPQYENRSFSYLCELLPLTESEAAEAVVHCNTVAELRQYKKDLKGHNENKAVATSQKIEPTVQNNATSQQNYPDNAKIEYDFRYTSISIPLFNSSYSKYGRFFSASPKTLCDRIMELETQLEAAKNEAKRYKMQYENEVAAAACGDCKSISFLDFDVMTDETLVHEAVTK